MRGVLGRARSRAPVLLLPCDPVPPANAKRPVGGPAPGAAPRASDRFTVSAPPLNLPKGGGALRGIGETFAASAATGTGTFTVPIATSAGRGDIGAGLELSYDSGAGAGPFGLGWSLSLPGIARRTDRGLPRYRDDTDEFVLSGGDDLVPALTKKNGAWVPEVLPPRTVAGVTYDVRRFLPRVERAFDRVERWTSRRDRADCFWRVISRDNVTTWFGRTAESRIADPDDATRIFSWAICERHDDKGNVVVYRYRAEDSAGVDVDRVDERHRTERQRTANRYLSRVLYGNHRPYRPVLDVADPWPAPLDAWYFEAVFDYGDHAGATPTPGARGQWRPRPDAFSSHRAGFELRTYRLCQRVLMFHHVEGEARVERDCLVASTDFTYDESPMNSRLVRVTESRYRRRGAAYDKRSRPPLDLEYSKATIDDSIRELESRSVENVPSGVDGLTSRWLDLDGEGLSGVLVHHADGWSYKRNLSPVAPVARLGPLEPVGAVPATRDLARGVQLLDLAGDGRLDVATFDRPNAGFYERTDEGWQALTPFVSMPNLTWSDASVRFVDLTGDGRADVLVADGEALAWYPSLGEAGFGDAIRVRHGTDERDGPRLLAEDDERSIHLADMTGDGLTDIVRIGNGEVTYWPNLGYGRFGCKVTMHGSPWFDGPDQFDHKRLRLADIDGSGAADLLYLGREGIDVYFNECGNGWARRRTLPEFPRSDDLSAVSAVDLLGNGTACLVWSTPLPGDRGRPVRYIDLMGGTKPHLLVRVIDNMGTETIVDYAPSTRFYLADELAGRPWATKVPFPVHVVERVTVRDTWKKSSFASIYSYHHGYFDGSEREFRGFGRVEQVDVESFGTFADGNAASPYVTDDKTLYQPPVKTVSWYHTGARVDGPYEDEYFSGDALPGGRLDVDELSVLEAAEALRACKGRLLRKEVYELDVDSVHEHGEHVPVRLLTTESRTQAIRFVQPQATNAHAVVLVVDEATVTAEHDLDLRDPAARPDPRVVHSAILRTDDYGNTEQSVSIAYPRRGAFADANLSAAQLAVVRAVQAGLHVAYTVTSYTDDVSTHDRHRLRVPCDVATYDVTGLQVPAAGAFTASGLRADVPAAAKRLVERVLTLSFRDDLGGFLPLGTQGSLGLTYETYKLALTTDLLDAVFDARLDDVADGVATVQAKLDDPAVSGYVHGQALVDRFSPRVPAASLAGQYWLRSGTAGYSADAADHFYRANRYVDPFGAVTALTSDARDLFVARNVDPLGNETRIDAYDYRVLAPTAVVDPNGNRHEVAFDVLGHVVASAVVGKGNDADDLGGFTGPVTDPPPGAVSAFCTSAVFDEQAARVWLRRATARFVYHFGEARDANGNVTAWAQQPPAACGITREVHAAAPGGAASPLQVALECSDGGGGVLMTKRRAEPEAPGGPPRWIVEGRTVVNNKGNPVQQFEPYFSDRFGCETAAAAGVTTVQYYDASGRTVRTEFPDGTCARIALTPWAIVTHDPNDTVLDAGNAWHAKATSAAATAEVRRAAALSAAHAGTPSTTHLDSLGREVVAVTHNRTKVAGGTRDDHRLSLTKLDPEGKPLWLRDQRGNLVTQYLRPAVPTGQQADPASAFVPCHDLAGNLLYSHSMDGGDRWTLSDAGGNAMAAWTANEYQDDAGAVTLQQRVLYSAYDALRRPTKQWQTIDGAAAEVVEEFTYGESLAPADAKERNLRGRLYRRDDPSGRMQVGRCDTDGNETAVSRTVGADTLVRLSEYDALGRVTHQYAWHAGTGSRVSVVNLRYNERGALAGEDVLVRATKTAAGHDADPAHPVRQVISEITYDAKGQRHLVRRGNGTVTRYTYDPARYRLVQLRTTRPNRVLQDLHYTYDAAGNVVRVRDEAFEPTFFDNQLVEAESRYEYDALYRLVEASGRESSTSVDAPTWQAPPAASVLFPVTDRTLRNYTEHYRYDDAGNLVEQRHVAAGGSWTRHLEYEAANNRLLRTWLGNNVADAVVHRHDTHGNVLNLLNVPATNQLRWDERDLLRAVDLGGGGWVHSTYDSSSRRTRRVATTNAGAIRWERVSLDGWERYRRYSPAGAVVEEIESLHVMAGDHRVLLVDDVIATDDANLTNGPLFRYQYGDHLESSTVEADDQARLISYEQYHPYGTTAYRATDRSKEVPARRYRYAGAECDEDTGLYCMGARYYVPWLARWASADPSGTSDGPNRYAYARGSPIAHTDRAGTNTNAAAPTSGAFIQFGVFREVTLTGTSSFREHVFAGDLVHQLLEHEYGKSATDTLYDRLYDNAPIIETPLSMKTPKDNADRATMNQLSASLAAKDPEAARMLYLQARKNEIGAATRAGFKLTPKDLVDLDKQMVQQTGVMLYKGEVLARDLKNGKKVPTRLSKILASRVSAQSTSSSSSGNGVKVTKFTAAPKVAPKGGGGGGGGGRGGGLSPLKGQLAGMGAGAVVQAAVDLSPVGSQQTKAAVAEVGGGIAGVGVEWVDAVGGVRNAATHARQIVPYAGATLAAGATTIAGGASAAFGATTLTGATGIAAGGGAAAVGVAGAAVVAAGAAGYAVGTVINKVAVEPLLDKLAPGSGAVGDWWYRNVLK